jgi:hypothetical protein
MECIFTIVSPWPNAVVTYVEGWWKHLVSGHSEDRLRPERSYRWKVWLRLVSIGSRDSFSRYYCINTAVEKKTQSITTITQPLNSSQKPAPIYYHGSLFIPRKQRREPVKQQVQKIQYTQQWIHSLMRRRSELQCNDEEWMHKSIKSWDANW